ncbi:MAG: acetyl-CoA C-acyltransferase [Chitinophagales bacterium]|jgi:acetyl-CoA C-acetyltransferase|nr:acetyl-CoA C-acyltransferase [Chitinophagales bacterium]
MKEVYIVAYGRLPIGSFNGSLSDLSAIELGIQNVKGLLGKYQIKPEIIQEVILGNVLQANNGQAPARQVALGSGLSPNASCITINKVCASGLKSIALGTQSIQLGLNDAVLVGGFESMSQAPYYIPKARNGYRYGNSEIIDAIVRDGLQDPFKKYMMGNVAEICAKKYNYSREDQDAYAIESYQRAQKAYSEKVFDSEIIPAEIPQRKGTPIIISEDEEYKNFKLEKVAAVNPAFEKEGTITAINASKINDGAAMMVLMSEEKMNALGLKPIAKVIGYADAEQEPDWFTTTPSIAIPKAIKHAKLTADQIDLYEINEAFSVVAMANNKELNLDAAKVNIFGGAVSLGHPIGASGARIACTLITALNHQNKKYGVAGICNGGGGATAVVFEKLV